MAKESVLDVETGSGNVFADLGLADSGERQLRTKLAVRLNAIIDEEALSQAVTAKRLGIAQPHVSELKNYKLTRFSSERLLHYITLFNRDIEIFIRPCASQISKRTPRQRVAGIVSVWAAA